MSYGNIYASMNPYADEKNRPGQPAGHPSGPNSQPGNTRPGGGEPWRPPPAPQNPPDNTPPRPGGGEPWRPPGPPKAPPAAPPPPADPIPAPSAVDPGYASATGGPAGVGGTGGYGFTNMAQYMYANPAGTGPGSGYAPTPTGASVSDFNPDMHGYAPNGGAYTGGMAGVDNALNQVYQRNTGGASNPTLQNPSYPSIYDNPNRTGPRGF